MKNKYLESLNEEIKQSFKIISPEFLDQRILGSILNFNHIIMNKNIPCIIIS